MNYKSFIVVALFYTFVIFALGHWLGSKQKPKSIQVIENVAEGKNPLKPNKPVVPVKRVRYETKINFETVTIEVPERLDKYLLTSLEPLSFEGSKVRFDYYSPVEGEFRSDYFEYPEPKFGYTVDAFVGYDYFIRSPAIGVSAGLRYKRVNLVAEAMTNFDTAYLLVGTKINLAHR